MLVSDCCAKAAPALNFLAGHARDPFVQFLAVLIGWMPTSSLNARDATSLRGNSLRTRDSPLHRKRVIELDFARRKSHANDRAVGDCRPV